MATAAQKRDKRRKESFAKAKATTVQQRRAKGKEIAGQHQDRTKPIPGGISPEGEFAKQFIEKKGFAPQRGVPATPATAEELAEVRRQRANAAAGLTRQGQSRISEVEVRRVGSREDVQALEDRPGVETPELEAEPQEGLGVHFGKSIWGEDTGVTAGFVKSAAAGAAAGAAAFSVGQIGTTLLSSAGLSGAGTSVAASGKVAKVATGLAASTGRFAPIPVTTKAARLVSSYLWSLVKGLKNPMVAYGILGTGLYTSYFWAPNEKGDAMTTMAISQGTAEKAEDWDSVLEIDEMMQEANDIQAGMPAIGFTEAERAKFKAAIKASATSADRAREAIAESGEVAKEAPREKTKAETTGELVSEGPPESEEPPPPSE